MAVILPKIFEGLQGVRLNNNLLQIKTGIASSLGVNNVGTKKEGQSNAYLVVDNAITVDIRKRGIGGVFLENPQLNIPDGVYYLFIGSDSEPNENGIIIGDNVKVKAYLSQVQGGFGSLDGIRNISVDIVRMKYLRQHPMAFFIQDEKLYPVISDGEGGHSWQYFSYQDWQPFKSAMTGGIYFDGRAMKYNDANATPITELEEGKHQVSFFRALAEHHKRIRCQIEYEGQGAIYYSNNAYDGNVAAYANGFKGVSVIEFMPRSSSSGRAMKFTVTGTAKITKLFALGSQAQQPM